MNTPTPSLDKPWPPIASIPLPDPLKKNLLITSALPYVNNEPHLGNLIGAVLSADVFSRWARQRAAAGNLNAIYICGTDEYGTATETKAMQEGLTPRQICDKYNAIHRDIYAWFDINFDHFGRTSTPQQTEICQSIFWDIYHQGAITEDVVEQLYCDSCQRPLSDRYVLGTCPNCGFEDARGDQCDHCQAMLNPVELIRPKCSTCSNTPHLAPSNHLFIDLPKISPDLQDWFQKQSVLGNWNTNALAMTQSTFRDGLKQKCITRDLKWGTQVPLQGFQHKVFYVWFDAPIGYISITATALGDHWKDWWLPENTNAHIDLIQFMGKDNIPFHTVVFPATLLATKKPWTMVHHLSTTEYLNYESGKFSKSRGSGVFGGDAKSTQIPPEVWRYYLLINRPEASDTIFTWADLMEKNNNELLANLGNFINRTITFLANFFNKKIPKFVLNDDDRQDLNAINEELTAYIQDMEQVSLKSALKRVMMISKLGNQYLQKNAPWKLIKTDKERAGSVLAFCCHLVKLIAVIVEPFMGGRFAAKIFTMLGLQHSYLTNQIPNSIDLNVFPEDHPTADPVLLFTALKEDEIESLKKRFSGTQAENQAAAAAAAAATAAASAAQSPDSAFLIDMRVGLITEIAHHLESDKLFCAKVDVGEDSGPRSVVAGLRDYYSLEELQNRKVVVVCNLVPATLAGVLSNGMLLTADKKGSVKLLECPHEAPIGTPIVPENVPLVQGPLLDRKAFQTASKLLRVEKDNLVVYNKKSKLVAGHIPIGAGGIEAGGKIK